MEQRHQRMLEEVLKLPGNDTCADCHAPAPRWASVNLGIFLCVGCASIHRKMGTHKSRVKSVTLDTWTRDQIVSVRTIGNTASNQIYNPNEKLHPPPSSYGAEERDSEIEKYIRRKYEQGAFKENAGAGAGGGRLAEPTSLNRARERDGRLLPPGAKGGSLRENTRNPELNDILAPNMSNHGRDRDLPPLPPTRGFSPSAPPRQRPTRSTSGNNLSTNGPIWNAPASSSSSSSAKYASANGPTRAAPPPPPAQTQTKAKVANLIDFSNTGGMPNSTLPLQINMSSQNIGYTGPNQTNGVAPSTSWNGTSSNGNAYLSASPSPSMTLGVSAGAFSTSPSIGNGFATSPHNGTLNGMYGTSPQPQQMGMFMNQPQQQPAYGQHLSPQPTYQSSSSASSSAAPSPSFVPQSQFGTSPSFVPQQTFQPQQQQQQQQFVQQGGYGQSPSYGIQQQQQMPGMGMGMGMRMGMIQSQPQGQFVQGQQVQQGGWTYGYVNGHQGM
ncbi:hypothetical protein CI109_105011 [Kwoniella shandongensis]|uniref:Uncharacterized protein n=1 Tax=Kwoniella shandongensis TaxID=1734106 RepID=A0A5M6BY79_9TREE|nr:uncharacterized protein CI109_004392 [Kwoniella shandongensis]KAA5527331.1 hypothetical protein CI109_004392 [Kwoniella shandongensis]